MTQQHPEAVPETEIAIDVRELRKSYGKTLAVADVDLQIRRGEVFALLGPNGAGKTTTVEILEGYRDRDAGQVQVLGVDPRQGDSAWRARLGLVLQSTSDFAHLTVAEVIEHFAVYYPNPFPPAEVIEQVGLTDKRTARVRTLSGGQRRRLDVGLGIIGRPELLFLDEPTTGFDPQARREFWKLITTLAHSGTTIVLTTHYLDEAETLADRVAVIAGGKLIEVATPATLGGRSTHTATVSWVLDGVRYQETTDTPTATVVRLSSEFDGDIPELTITRPSLEDIYLAMIGAPQNGSDL